MSNSGMQNLSKGTGATQIVSLWFVNKKLWIALKSQRTFLKALTLEVVNISQQVTEEKLQWAILGNEKRCGNIGYKIRLWQFNLGNYGKLEDSFRKNW